MWEIIDQGELADINRKRFLLKPKNRTTKFELVMEFELYNEVECVLNRLRILCKNIPATKEGFCPYCHTEINYDEIDREQSDEGHYWKVQCNCGEEFKEYYEEVFNGHEDMNGNTIKYGDT